MNASSAAMPSGPPGSATTIGGWFPLTRFGLAVIRAKTEGVLETLGLSVDYGGQVLRFLLAGKLSRTRLLQQASVVGVDSLGIALVLTTFSGMVIALEMAKEMAKQGAGNFVGALVALSIVRELAPIMTGFAVIALAGSAFAAELSTMKITNQVDALRVLHVHPVRYLMLPRVMAGMLCLPLMTVITAICGIAGGMLISHYLAEIPTEMYLDSAWQILAMKDVGSCLTKSAVFGFLIALISCTIGIETTGGAREVGIATTRAVVWSFIAMTIADYILTYLFYAT
ncbi:MAG: MlaE family ABC transporter permease [Candidatus Melainabacteria bacterium]